MLSRRIVAGRPSLIGNGRRLPIAQQTPGLIGNSRRLPIIQQRYLSQADIDDPGMNGGYINPPAIKRQHRSAYESWWDPQERRNYGEPVHEDNDILGMFSPHDYTHAKPSKAIFQIACFVMVVLGLCGVVSFTYPDMPTVPRQFEGGLEKELGGPLAVRARAPGDN